MSDCRIVSLLFFITFFVAQVCGATEVEHQPALGVISEGPKRIVIGSHLIVEEFEVLEEVVVIAGTADIKGSVGRLIVVGSQVRLFPTAIIRQELNSLGGLVQKDKGAQVNGQNVKVGIPLSERSWHLIFDKLKKTKAGQFLTQDSTKFMFSLFKIFALMVFAICGFYMAPAFQRHIKKYLKTNFPKCIMWGAVSLLLILPITMFLALSVVGIPLMPLQFSIYFLFFVFGYIHGARLVVDYLGKWLKPLLSLQVLFKVLLGLIFLEILIFIPYLGGVIKWLVIFAGFGAVSKVFYHQALMPEGRKYA